ncbi:MAG TPA: hypothetical protein VKM36_04650 [Balneolaceae bacterium]|nr:hypothetical protein [Balneolaceae bacterium]
MKHLVNTLAIIALLAGLIVEQCNAQSQQGSEDGHSGSFITIVAEDYAFQAPDQILSGWTTFQYENQGNEAHFLFLTKMPEGVTFDEYAGDALVPFNAVWYALRDEGINTEEVMERLGAQMPDWFWTLEFTGGAGIISPGITTDVTLNLEPGTYALECYMKTEDGELHSMEGMLRELTVTDTPSEAAAPEADIAITLSNFEMAIDGNLSPGNHTVSVHVAENPEEGYGHNVHVTRLADDTNTQEIAEWMDWFDVNGLQNPSPAMFTGGMQLLPEGGTGYFSLDLEPGRYLFYSEYTGHLGVFQEITVE